MASYLDRTPNFNPYVEQLPIDAMVKVGMDRQQRYDQGIQKIQTSIDNVAGLDVMRDVDKQYLQSRLNELGTNLKSVAAADFSNNQMVTSTAGMAAKIGKDPYITAAVQSTTWDSQQQKELTDAKKKGTSSPANEFNYNKRRSEYLNAGLTDDKGKPLIFSSPYLPYFDVDKFTKETFDAVKPDGLTFDEVYQTDGDGKRIVDKTVNPKTGKTEESYRLSNVMSRLKQEGRFPEKVRETLEHIMSDPRVGQQLQISGEYNYQGYTPTDLTEKLTNLKQRQLVTYDDEIRTLSLRKTLTANQTDKDKIDNAIEKLSLAKESTTKQFQDLSKLVTTNPDGLRGLLYKDEVRDNYRAMYSTMTEERTMMTSPAFQATLELQKEANLQVYRRQEMGLKFKALSQEDENFHANLNYKIAKDVKGQVENIPTTGATPSNIDILKRFNENYDKSAAKYSESVMNVVDVSGLLDKQVNEYLQNNPGRTRKQAVMLAVKQMAAEKGISEDVAYTKLTTDAIKALRAHPDIMESNPEIKSAIIAVTNNYRDFNNEQARKKKIDAIAPEYKDENAPNFKITSELISLARTVVNNKDSRFESNRREATVAKEKLKSLGIDDAGINYLHGIAPGTSIPAIAKVYNDLKNKFIKHSSDANDLRAKVIQENYMFNPILEKSITTGDVSVDKTRLAEASALIGKYNSIVENASAPAMSLITTGKEKGTVVVTSTKNEIDESIVPKLVVYNEKGVKVGDMTITPQEATSLGQDINTWYKSEDALKLETKVLTTGNNSTSYLPLNDVSAYTGIDRAWDRYSGSSKLEKLTSGVDVAGHVKEGTDSKGNKVFYPYLYVSASAVPIIKLDAVYSMDEALQKFNNITPDIIIKLISENSQK